MAKASRRFDEPSTRLCHVVSADLEGADGGGDGCEPLFDLTGSPEKIGQAIAETLTEADMMRGRNMMIENGEDLYLVLKIKFCDPQYAETEEDSMADEKIPQPEPSFYDDPFFTNKPIFRVLQDNLTPHPALLRACLIELWTHVLMEHKAKALLADVQATARKNEPPSVPDLLQWTLEPVVRETDEWTATAVHRETRTTVVGVGYTQEEAVDDRRKRIQGAELTLPECYRSTPKGGTPSSASTVAEPLHDWDFGKAYHQSGEGNTDGAPYSHWCCDARRRSDGVVRCGYGACAEQAYSDARTKVMKFITDEIEKKRTAPITLKRVAITHLVEQQNHRPDGWRDRRYLFLSNGWHVGYLSSRVGVLLTTGGDYEGWYSTQDLDEVYELPVGP